MFLNLKIIIKFILKSFFTIITYYNLINILIHS